MARVRSYHPALVFAEKRKQKALEREKARVGLAKIELPKEDIQPGVDPKLTELTGDELALYKAEKFIETALSVVEDGFGKFKALIELNQEALAVDVDDNDRKAMHRKYLVGMKEIDDISAKDIDGVKLFSGAFSKEPKKISLEEVARTVGESVTLRIDALNASNLRLDRIKIDTLINARKAVSDFDRGKDVFEAIIKMLKSKLDTINYKQRQLKSATASENTQLSVKGRKAYETDALNRIKQEYLNNLRAAQEHKAEVTGQEKALLINSKG